MGRIGIGMCGVICLLVSTVPTYVASAASAQHSANNPPHSTTSVAPSRDTGTRSGSSGSRTPNQGHTVNWNQRDVSVYVVSTVNLLRSSSGQTLAGVLEGRLGVQRYDVYADTRVNDLYFIQAKRGDGSVVGALAYQMGWAKPRSLTDSISRLGVSRAPRQMATTYRDDPKQLLGTYTSTLPQ